MTRTRRGHRPGAFQGAGRWTCFWLDVRMGPAVTLLGERFGTAGAFKCVVSAHLPSVHTPSPDPRPPAFSRPALSLKKYPHPRNAAVPWGGLGFVLIPTMYLNVLSSRPLAPPTFPAGRPLWPPCLPKWVAWTVPRTVPWGVGPAWGSVPSVLHLFPVQKVGDEPGLAS